MKQNKKCCECGNYCSCHHPVDCECMGNCYFDDCSCPCHTPTEKEYKKVRYNTTVGDYYFCKDCMPSIKELTNKLIEDGIKTCMEQDENKEELTSGISNVEFNKEGGINISPHPSEENWEKEFDGKFNNYGRSIANYNILSADGNELKSFIRHLLKDREKEICEKIKKLLEIN